MSANHKLSVVIGAALKNSFTTAISSSTKQLGKLGSTIKKLETQGKSIQSLDKLKRDTLSAKRAWSAAEAEVKQLAAALKATTKPSKELQKAFEKSKQSAAKAKTAYLKNRNSLSKLSNQMHKSGMDMRNLSSQQLRLGRSVEKLKHRYQSLDRIMKKRDGVLARRAALRGQMLDAVALGATLAAPLKAAIDFESAMADVRKVVEFDTPDGLQKLGEELKNMSRTIPISAAGLAQIAASGGQLGVAAENLGAFTDTVSKMAIAYDMSAEEAGNAMAKLANVYQIPITEMSKLGDAINHLSDNTAAKARDMVPALNMIGGTARQFGLTAVQSSALVSAFISLGKAPTKAGTAINAMLSKLQTAGKQGKKFQDAFKSLGLDIKAFEEQLKTDAQGAILSFLETVEKLDKQARSGVLFDLFGMEYQDDLALLVGSLKEYKKAITAVGTEQKYAGSMQREFANRAATTANNLQLLKNSLSEVGINLGNLVLPALNSIVGAIRGVTTSMAEFAQTYPTISKVVVGLAVGLMGVKIAAIGLGYAWTFIQGGALTLVAAWRGLLAAITLAQTGFIGFNATALITAGRLKILAVGGAIKTFGASLMGLASRVFPVVITGFRALTVALMTNPIGLIVGGLALAAGLVISKWDTVKSFFMNLWEPIKPIWESFMGFVSKFWDTIKKPLQAIGKVWDWIWGKDKNATIEVGDAKPIKEALSQPLASARNLQPTNNTQNNHFNIKIETLPGQDTRAIADEVVRRFQAESRGALYDPIGATP